MGQARADELHGVLSSVVRAQGLDLFDLEVAAGLVRVTVDREGGIDLEDLASANRALSRALDELDPLPGRYSLEVSSPGLERRLRTPGHFAGAVGETVMVRLRPGSPEPRRLRGRLVEAGEGAIVVETAGGRHRLDYDQVERARTELEWGATPREGVTTS
ncbi:MAG: ribosome maturation factor RimP [Acidimicrobiales bacterium]